MAATRFVRAVMRPPSALVAVASLLFACSKTPASSDAGPPGTGDGSGWSVANARALQNHATASFKLACGAKMFFGPFRFTKDPETLTIKATAKSPSGAQICLGGEWLDATGKHAGGLGLACVDGSHTAVSKVTYEYSPGNGAGGVSPVYMSIAFADPKPEGCPTADLTLELP